MSHPLQWPLTPIDSTATERILLAEVLLWGTPDDLFERFSDYRDAGLRHLVIQPISGMISRRSAVYSLRAVVSIQRRLRRS